MLRDSNNDVSLDKVGVWKVEAVKNIAEWLRLRVDIRIIA